MIICSIGPWPSSTKRNLILISSNGLAETTIVQKLAYQGALAGRSVLFRLATDYSSWITLICRA